MNNRPSKSASSSEAAAEPSAPGLADRATDPSAADCAADRQRLQRIRGALRDIRIKIESYKRHNAQLLKDLRKMIDVLDCRYRELQRRIDWIQMSIIVCSSTSSFFLASKHVVVVPAKFIDFFALCVTTFTSMSLTVSKYYKFEEKKEHVSQLRSALSSLVVDVQSRDDAISSFEAQSSWKSTVPKSADASASSAANLLFPLVMPWMAGTSEENDTSGLNVADDYFEVCSDEWEKLDTALKQELTVISDKKLQLTREFERSLMFHDDYKNKIEIRTEISRMKHRDRMEAIDSANDSANDDLVDVEADNQEEQKINLNSQRRNTA